MPHILSLVLFSWYKRYANRFNMSNRLMEALNVHGFPTYMFIKRNGTILTKDIPGFFSTFLPEFIKSNAD